MSDAAAAPGWYPDPWFPGGVRWFDGTEWTPHIAGPAGLGPADVYDGDKGAKTARWASWAFVGRGIAGALQYLLIPLLFGNLWDEMRTATSSSDVAFNPFELGGAFVGAQLGGLVLWAALAFLCIWSFRATRNARALGLTTTFDATWAAAGWVLPGANLVLPYLVVRDLFPVGHRGRRAAGWWWGSELTGGVLGFAAFAAALFGGAAWGVTVGVVPAALLLSAGLQGRRLVRWASDEQVAAARAAGLT